MAHRAMLVISAREWEGLQSRPHHLMRFCSRSGWRVLFLEPPASLIAPIKNGSMLGRWRNWRKGLRRTREGIRLLAPPPILPFGNKRRPINKLNQRLIARTVKKALRQLDISATDVYSFLPNVADLLPHLRYDRLIYDCVDDHASFSGLISAEQVRVMEREVMRRAHVSFASARSLLTDRMNWSSNFHLIPNGCEYEHFEPASRRGALPTPMDLKQLVHQTGSGPSPLVGFMGGLGEWVDYDLLADLARLQEHLNFVFLGPTTARPGLLKSLANVHFLGPKPYGELPWYMQHFSVCLIPFRLSKLTESVNPIKLYEYLSAGKPVVSTPLPEVMPYRDFIDIESDAPGFAEAIDRNLAGPGADPEKIRLRQMIGRKNAWSSRWNQALELIQAIPPKPLS